MCDNCPFDRKGQGVHLRQSLGRGRWAEILAHLRADGHFQCHKTTDFDDDGEAKRNTGLLCAGSLEWQMKRLGHHGQLARIMASFK